MSQETVDAPRIPDPVPVEVATRLGVYVYALRDPRDGTVFYIGKGRGSRVLHHVWQALDHRDLIRTEDAASGDRDPEETTSKKLKRIREIHEAGRGVEHHILTYDVHPAADDDRAAYAAEQVALSAFALQSGSALTNLVGGHVSTEHRPMRLEELVTRYAALPVPALPERCVLVKVNGASAPDLTAADIYEMSRGWWRAGSARLIEDLPVIVFADDVVRAVHRAVSWESTVDDSGKRRQTLWRYTGSPDAELEAIYKGGSLRDIRAARPTGRWRQHGWHPYL